MMHRFPNRTAALRSLKDISVDAIQHAKQLITEEDGMFCFDEDTAEQYLDNQSTQENNMTSNFNVQTATTAQLVEFYNDHAESSIKKFRDRATAEARCQAILDAIAEEESKPVAKSEKKIGGMTLAETVAFAQAVAGKKSIKTAPKAEPVYVKVTTPGQPAPSLQPAKEETIVEEGVRLLNTYGFTHCPKCGEHLSNGVGEHQQEVNGKKIKHDEFQFECLACGEEFGPSIHKASESEGERAPSVTQADTMKTSLKLDRTIVATWKTAEGNECSGEWKNAYQMWKANPTWMTSSQQDTLTAKLYAAAKKGDKITVEINGRAFELLNV